MRRPAPPAKLKAVRSVLPLCLLWATALAASQTAPAVPAALTAAQSQALVGQVLAAELLAAQDTSHPMRYLLRKQSPRVATTREIFETREGDVARLLSVNGQPLSAAAAAKESLRLQELAQDPGRQRHRKQAEDADTARALKVLRALPSAFLYQYAGPGQGPAGTVEKFTFTPNPAFTPPDLETQVLTAMAGELWIDPAAQRVTHIEAQLRQEVDFGWGILGRLNKGGSIAIDQAQVVPGQWRIVRLKMQMSGRVLFKTRNFDTVEEESQFAPLPVSMTYRQAIVQLQGIEEKE